MIILFSGCGNTAKVADELSRLTADSVLRLTPAMLRSGAVAPSIEATGPRVIWAFPVYSWGVPPVVRRFIRNVRLRAAYGIPHIMVATCGDDAGACADMWRRDIEARGWNAFRAFSVQMPNTYVMMRGFDVDSPEVAARKLAAMPSRVGEIVSEIDSPGADDVVRGSWPRFKTHVIYPGFVRYAMSPKPFHATDACIGCGACVRHCPMANISLSEGKPRWGSECAFCLGCYHVCPLNAVAYGRATAGKGQYRM